MACEPPSGAVALVTGGSSGIGKAICLRLAQQGYDIWLNFRSNDAGALGVQRQIREDLGRECTLLKFDVGSPEKVNEVLGPALSATTPHVFVHNAGVNSDSALALMSYEEWREVIRTNLDGFFLVGKLVVTGMIRERRGRVITITSASGQVGVPGQVNYSAAKAGLIGATRSLAAEVARRNILVNAVAPGLIDTAMTQKTDVSKLLGAVPLRRMGEPEEVAGVVAFLCSEESRYMTGQVLGCSGGLVM